METQWIVVGLGVLGFFLTWTGMVVAVTRAVSSIKEDTGNRITTETAKITEQLKEISDRFEADQRTQDNRYGEVATAIRQYVANVEKEMHQIEIWGRDNFVLKSDFKDALGRVESAIANMGAIIREELKIIRADINGGSKEHDS